MKLLILIAMIVLPVACGLALSRFRASRRLTRAKEFLFRLANAAPVGCTLCPPNGDGMPSTNVYGTFEGIRFFVTRYETTVALPYHVQLKTPEGEHMQFGFPKEGSQAVQIDTIIRCSGPEAEVASS